MLLVIGAWLGKNLAIQPGFCYSCPIRVSTIGACEHGIDKAISLFNVQNRFHAGRNDGDSASFGDSTVSDGMPQLLDLEDDGVLAPGPNTSGIKVSPCSEINSTHHINRAKGPGIPLYLLKSSFLL